MKNLANPRALTVAIAGLLAALNGAYAAPTGGAYVSDTTQSYVNDATNQGLRLPNTVLCYMHGTGANLAEVLNVGDYIALVDKNKCEKDDATSNTVTGDSGASSAPDYLVTAVNATRTDNSSPLVGKVWFRETSLGDPSGNVQGIIYAKLTATESASATSPYGQFHTDFCGLPDSNPSGCVANAPFYGFAEGNGASIRAFQTGNGSHHQDVSVALTGSVAAGTGRVKFSESGGASGDWVFAYDADHFRRADNGGANDQCFDRSFANAEKTAWSYGVYAADGSRLNRTSGFPIRTQAGDNGYIGYWGMWLPPGVMVSDGDSVTRFSYSNNQASSGTYTVVKKDGRLKKQVLGTTTLGAITSVPFYLWVQTGFTDSGSTTRSAGSNLEVKWDGTNFVITGVVQMNGPVTPVTGSPTIPGSEYSSTGQWAWSMSGYSQSIGGSIAISMRDGSGAYQAPSNATSVSYRTETVVAPGSSDWPATLVCVTDCPAGGIADATALTAASDNPFLSGTRGNWAPTLVASAVTYTTTNGLLVHGGQNVAWTGSVPSGSQFANGIQSGRMVSTTDAGGIACDSNGAPNAGGAYYCASRLDAMPTIYVWETGANSWNKYAGLSSGGTAVAFDPPLPLTYVVPSNGTPYASASLILQYNGFGDLQGIPGKCVDPVTNADATCDSNGNTRWVSAFAIPEGSTVSDGATTYYVKPLQQEVRLAKVSATNCSGLSLPTIADSELPGVSSWVDPTANGAMPTVTTAPKVIDGILQ